ncbi:MAG: glucose-6-phosphate isomerase, partial [Planctomycetota bacterium]|nr:glucose-6-phosphate isomerase [Planctomycetota bacterium]
MSIETTDHTLTDRPEWKALEEHLVQIMDRDLKRLFSEDDQRGPRFTVEGAGIFLDYSKNRITDRTVSLLLDLARACDLEGRRERMFTGEKINITEDRAVLHTALRAPRDAVVEVDGVNVIPHVHEVLDRMGAFATGIRSGEWKGHTGKRIRNVVNIGIGGSDLGPVMAYEALKPFSDRSMCFRFVSNVDSNDFYEKTRDLSPEETLFIISSKTFTTLETMTNAHTAREWSLEGLGCDESAVAKHFVAVSTNKEAVESWGVGAQNMVGVWG